MLIQWKQKYLQTTNNSKQEINIGDKRFNAPPLLKLLKIN